MTQFLRSLPCVAFALAASLTGCIAESANKAPYETLEISDDATADSFTRKMSVRGTLDDASASVYGDIREREPVGYLFTGRRGANVTLDASVSLDRRGGGLDSVLMLYGPQGPRARTWNGARPFAENDDYRRSLNSHLTARLPEDGTYLVVVAEYNNAAGKFSLQFTRDGAALFCTGAGADRCPAGAECITPECGPSERCARTCEAIDPTDACEVDTDCAVIDTSCCCPRLDAVNAESAEALTPECGAGTLCPAVVCRETPVATAACVANKCEVQEAPGCTSDDDCPQPLCLPGGPCPRFECNAGECVRHEETPACTADSDCPTIFCIRAPCPQPVCRAGECVPPTEPACTTDDDCPRPACLPGGPCPRLVCSDAGECVPQEGFCREDTDCPRRVCVRAPCPQQICVENQCAEPPPPACVRGGCSGQLCIEEGAGGITTCEFRPEYACYAAAPCERQPSGACGHTPSATLTSCLEDAHL